MVNVIGVYMCYFGVWIKSGDKKLGRNFFWKKVMGNWWLDEFVKIKKGLSSILDVVCWNWGEF